MVCKTSKALRLFRVFPVRAFALRYRCGLPSRVSDAPDGRRARARGVTVRVEVGREGLHGIRLAFHRMTVHVYGIRYQMYISIYIFLSLSLSIHVYIYIYIYIHICTHIYTHTYRRADVASHVAMSC